MNKEIIAQGKWSVNRVLIINEGEFQPSDNAKQSIDDSWNTFVQANPQAFNGPLVRLKSWKMTQDGIELSTQSTDYACYIGTRNQEFLDKFSEEDCAKPLGMTIVPVTSDGNMIVTQRSIHAEQNPGTLYFIGGYIESGLNQQGEATTIWEDIKRETKEEMDIELTDISDCTVVGFAYDYHYFHPELFVVLRLNTTTENITDKWRSASDSLETEKLLPLNVKSVIAAYQNKDLPHPPSWSFITAMELALASGLLD